MVTIKINYQIYKCALLTLFNIELRTCQYYSAYNLYLETVAFGNSNPCLYIDKCVRIKLQSFFTSPKFSASRKPFFVPIRLLDLSSKFALKKKQLPNTVSKFYPQLKLKVVFGNRMSVGSSFKYRD